MPAPKNNQNAAKSEAEKASTWLQVRVTASEKDSYESKAKAAGKSLSKWIRDKLSRGK